MTSFPISVSVQLRPIVSSIRYRAPAWYRSNPSVGLCVWGDQVSADGYNLVLLLSTRDTYVAVINLRTNKIAHELAVSGCSAVHLSPKSDYICTSSVREAVKVVRVFMLRATSVKRALSQYAVLYIKR